MNLGHQKGRVYDAVFIRHLSFDIFYFRLNRVFLPKGIKGQCQDSRLWFWTWHDFMKNTGVDIHAWVQ